MEIFMVHAMESIIRGDEWESGLAPFYTTNCPRFRSFQTLYNANYTSSIAEIDLQMTLVHSEFIELVEEKMRSKLAEMGMTETAFLNMSRINLGNNDETAERLFDHISNYYDFIKFGTMMELKYKDMYGPSLEFPLPAVQPQSSSTRPEVVLTNAAVATARICRVLWDLENMPVNANVGGLQTVTCLRSFLRDKQIMGSGIDTRITAFFHPFNRSISKKSIEELNKASVELVCASAKREDADRKLGMRINQDMQLLNPSTTTFVIISSDQDFRHHIQLLSNAGFQAVVIHNAQNDRWKQVLEMHATASYGWQEVVPSLPLLPNVVATVSSSSDPSSCSTNAGSQDTPVPIPVAAATSTALGTTAEVNEGSSVSLSSGNNNNSCGGGGAHRETIAELRSRPQNADPNLDANGIGSPAVNKDDDGGMELSPSPLTLSSSSSSGGGGMRNSAVDPQSAVGWRVAVCQRWSSAFGFLLVDVSKPAVMENFTCSAEQHAQLADPQTAFKCTEHYINRKNSKSHHGNHAQSGLVRVYVHTSALTYKPDGLRMLKAGEYVLVNIVLDQKGPKAIAVRELMSTSSSATPQITNS